MKRFFSRSKSKSDSTSSNLSLSAKHFFNHNNNSTNTNSDNKSDTIGSNSNSLDESSTLSNTSTPKIGSLAATFGKRLLNSDASPNIPKFTDDIYLLGDPSNKELSPELVPIVTLLTAQSHRRYHKGVILLLHDLKNDGTPSDRIWKEYYAVIIGSQLALWNANDLANNNNNNNNSNFKNSVSKPKYINFTDATLRPIDSNDSIILNDKSKRFSHLENVLVISTTLKNRYFLKFSDLKSYHEWTAAIHLSLYENLSLQEAYTGAFLSSRGSKLGDIKNIMATDNKFTYSEWVSVRFGAGMPWKRCYAVISQSTSKRELKWKSKKYNRNDTEHHTNNKNNFKDNLNDRNTQNGIIRFYENDKKITKKNAMATVTEATTLYAVYPSSPLLIDNSTIIKLDGTISFDSSLDSVQHGSIFIMAEKHLGVPSYDTIIRFLIPAMNAFNLYGRPKQLIANRNDPRSLMFAVPTLPAIYYLEVKDILKIINSNDTSHWNNEDWNEKIDQLLVTKITKHKYTGCRVKNKSPTIYSSPTVKPKELVNVSRLGSNSSSCNQPTFESNIPNNNSSIVKKLDNSKSNEPVLSPPISVKRHSLLNDQDINETTPNNSNRFKPETHNNYSPLSPQRELNKIHDTYTNNPNSLENSLTNTPNLNNKKNDFVIPPKYNNSKTLDLSDTEGYESPYEEYVGINSDNIPFNISGIEEPIDYNDELDYTSAHSSNFDIKKYSDEQSSANEDDEKDADDIPVKRIDNIDKDLPTLIDKINGISMDESKNALIGGKDSNSFNQRFSMEPQMFPDDEIDPGIISGLHLNNISFIEEKQSKLENQKQPYTNQSNGVDVTDPQYFEQSQLNETQNFYSKQNEKTSNSEVKKQMSNSPSTQFIPKSNTSMNLHYLTQDNTPISTTVTSNAN